MAKTQSISSLAPNPKNPRKVTDKKLQMLRRAMDRFGDLGGIVVNKRTGQLISGHQRREAFVEMNANTITIEREYESPTRTGTIAEGFVDLNGERFSYRLVDFDEQTAAAASLAANKNAGEWSLDLLSEQFSELQGMDIDLDLTMFSVDERAFTMDKVPDSEDENQPEVKDKALNRCPSCGHEWTGRADGVGI